MGRKNLAAPGVWKKYLATSLMVFGAVVLLCIRAADKLPRSFIYPLVCTGQMVLTHYVAHVVVAMAALESMGELYNQPLSFAVGFSCFYFACSMLFSMAWQARFAKGPLETVMRRIAG